MNYRGYNDYELLYLINGGTEEAREIMIEKYQGLIYKKLHKYYYKSFDKDDLYQELQMVLLKAIDKYQENDQKTFTKFLELLIDHKLVDLLKKDLKVREVINDSEYINNCYYLENHLNELVIEELLDKYKYGLSELESKVYQYKFIHNYKVKEISNILNIDSVNVTNAIQRIKKKIKKANN